MIPITIEEDGTVKKADISNEWYNYAEKKWANVVILNVDDTYTAGQVIPASTTGNIYGIYDLSGGSWECVMGYNTLSRTIGGDSGFGSNVNLIDSKYIDKYENTSTGLVLDSIGCSTNNCIGHALSETGGYYSDFSYFLNVGYPWFIRGGFYNVGANAGIFSSSFYEGGANTSNSSRSIIITH